MNFIAKFIGIIALASIAFADTPPIIYQFTAPLHKAADNRTITCNLASGSQPGCLSSSDWTSFNNKQAGPLTGDVTTSGAVATLKSIPNKVYVDFISGLDTNTGTIVQPWKTLQHAYNSISPSINEPYVIYLSGGNNDTDVGTITGKPDTSIVADFPTQVNALTISGGVTNSNGVTFINLIFTGAVTWTRNDSTTIGMTLINTEFFSGPTLKQTGTGTASMTAISAVFVNSEFLLGNGGFGIFNGCSFLGTTAFDDPGTSGLSYLELIGSYSDGAMTITGHYNPVYFAGFVQDVTFGASLSFVSGTGGFAALETDSAGLPPTYTGTPSSIVYLSKSQTIDYTKGALLGGVSAPTGTNVLLEVHNGHIKSSQTTAPTTTVNANAGTSATCTVSGATDSAGSITLVTGSAAWASGDQCDITFNKVYNVAPKCVMTPTNANAAASAVGVYLTKATTALSVNFSTADNAATTYTWDYNCVETQ